MKKVFVIVKLMKQNVCVPSNDFYAKSGDWREEDVPYLCFENQEFLTEQEAIEQLEREEGEGLFMICPIYIKNSK